MPNKAFVPAQAGPGATLEGKREDIMRESGILMHISSLPSPHGIGTMGEEAYKFVDFLKEAGQKNWQVLPLGPTSYGDSPYQSFSVFAGNPYFIDLDLLKEQGLLRQDEIDTCDFGSEEERVDYENLFQNRASLLKKAFSRFEPNSAYQSFVVDNAFWLEDYALFLTVKECYCHCSWLEWGEGIRLRKPWAVAMYRDLFAEQIAFQKFVQFLFFSQWSALKAYANQNGVRIIGDMPIYVALDSADVWGNSRMFQLDQDNRPLRVAGCPPDGFSPTGQLWGNPLYNWEAIRRDGYGWWVRRVRAASKLYDVTRIDHFRGFESYYAIPFGDETAEHGEWFQGPGYALFETIKQELGEISIIAEDLGFLTPEVHTLLEQCGYPGMKVLQFAFNPWDDNDYLPHNFVPNCVAYTGTHDNDTTLGWTESTPPEEVEYAAKYLHIYDRASYPWAFLRAVWGSVAQLAIAPMQDFLALGSEARMNTPSVLGGNWQWRMKRGAISPELTRSIRELTEIYRRA